MTCKKTYPGKPENIQPSGRCEV